MARPTMGRCAHLERCLRLLQAEARLEGRSKVESGHLLRQDRGARCLGHRRRQQSLPQQVDPKSGRRKHQVHSLLPRLYSVLMGIPTELWRPHGSFEEVATMVGGPLLGLPSQGTGGVARHDEDAKEVIAFSRSYAGKLEEVKDLVDVEEKKAETSKELSEEQRLAEDKKLDYAEEKVTLPMINSETPIWWTKHTTKQDLQHRRLHQEEPRTEEQLQRGRWRRRPKENELSPSKAVHLSEVKAQSQRG